MRKVLVILLLVLLALPVFADDAKILPAGVIRITLAPNYGFVPGAYDTDGKYTGFSSGEGRVNAWNIGAAIEYGVTDWISAAVQWAPGWNVSAPMDADLSPSTSSANVNGLYSLFTGAEFQLVGEQAPVKSETVRFALAAGVKIPIGSVDFADQYTNLVKGSDVTLFNVDKPTLGFGGRLYADYIFSKAFFLNLYSELIYYPGTVAFKDSSFENYATYLNYGINPDVGYGYDLTVEVEPHYDFQLSEDATLEGSLPFTFTHSPNWTYSPSVPGLPDTYTSLLVVRPTLDLFLMKSPVPFPIELKLAYSLPIAGWDTGASNALIFLVRMYLKF